MYFLLDFGGYSFANLGDTAMLLIAVSRIYKYYPSAIIYIFTNSEKDLKLNCPRARAISPSIRNKWLKAKLLPIPERIIQGRFRHGFRELQREIKFLFPKTSNVLMRLTQLLLFSNDTDVREFFKVIQMADMVIASGGGYINDSFPFHANNVLETLSLAQRLGKPTAMFGQGIGPIRKKSIMKNARKVFPRLDAIGLREGLESLEVVKKMNVPHDRIFITGDDAIEIALKAGNKPNIRQSIGVNIRQAKYAGEIESHLPEIGKLINEIARSINAAIIPIPIHIGDSFRDLMSVKNFCHVDDSEYDIARRITVPSALIRQINRCRIVITGSYHAAVFSLAHGIPVVALVGSDYYEAKFTGLANQFEGGCKIIHFDSKNLLESLRIAIEKSLQFQGEFENTLVEKAKVQVELSKTAWERFLCKENL